MLWATCRLAVRFQVVHAAAVVRKHEAQARRIRSVPVLARMLAKVLSCARCEGVVEAYESRVEVVISDGSRLEEMSQLFSETLERAESISYGNDITTRSSAVMMVVTGNSGVCSA